MFADKEKKHQIEHVVRLPTEYIYGYLCWNARDQSKYEKVFPRGKFKVIFMGVEISDRHVDWKRCRVNLYPARKMIRKGDILIIRRENNTVYINKRS